MRDRCFTVFAAVSAMVLHTPAFAQGAKASSAPELARQAEKLKPGEWVWAGAIAPSGPLLVYVYVDLSRQLAPAVGRNVDRREACPLELSQFLGTPCLGGIRSPTLTY
ncbi:hypothetical protein [Sphingomonas sp. BAUL-RG-20F-R05-02]|uniref:hypothetical protein n=1 Tax=Sphingomonas sp. BAUL-RG-20F-R05-02 TaxID=2914830 RepID=UPI001F574694|nr:hypothetical protein [Sphingomonas sp. BAUL-RG-20F-R05-02]